MSKDSAGRFFASFTVETDPAADAARMPDSEQTVGIDLGLSPALTRRSPTHAASSITSSPPG